MEGGGRVGRKEIGSRQLGGEVGMSIGCDIVLLPCRMFH